LLAIAAAVAMSLLLEAARQADARPDASP